MEVFLTVLHIGLCFFLLLVVLLQPGKGADFGAAMGGASQEMLGATGSVSLLAKVTTVVAAMFMGTSLGLAWFSNAPQRSFIGGDELEQEIQEQQAPDDGGAAAPTGATDTAPAADVAPPDDVEPAEGSKAAGSDSAPTGEAQPDEAQPDEGAAPAGGTDGAPGAE